MPHCFFRPACRRYYLYERDGKLGLLPWDYNAALGCLPIDGIIAHTNPADIVINQGIDTPLVGAKEAERRAENVRRQLSGTLVSRTKQQNPADRVDTSDIDLAVLKTGQRQ